MERSTKASFQTEVEHLRILLENNYYDKIPKIIEDGYFKEKKYLVLTKIEGKRLSDIFLKINDQELKNNYLIKYGKELAKIHNIPSDLFSKAKQRPINDYPSEDKYQKNDATISKYINYLIKNKPNINYNTFIHGDFHYANVLWKNKKISGVLDWEYSGKGFKEQDIAWACILRSTQRFMDNIEDIKHFLLGYNMIGSYNKDKLKWCLINGYCHFYLLNKDDKEYRKKIIILLLEINKDNF
ncbi:MAG: aminoglycoside phosphotransferase family protein [Bacilli bacterium]|nr:aminoglycoside phosphotransferase family protein [Bacilli bacterium]